MLDNIFDMIKADKYTESGKAELIAAHEAETEDRRYNNGEISEKTGLMKTPNGWVTPKQEGNKNSVAHGHLTKAEDNPYDMTEEEIKQAMKNLCRKQNLKLIS